MAELDGKYGKDLINGKAMMGVIFERFTLFV
jgi:hypothetical protein